MSIKKVTFITGHSWKSNRQGGFHKFAEACCKEGIQVVFFSFPRPYYSYFQHQELYNKKAIKELQKGILYDVENSHLLNVTYSTFKLPNFANRFLPDELMNALERLSVIPFKKFAKKHLANTDVFVFESCDGIILAEKLRKLFPNASQIYRPSDPLMYEGALTRYIKNETKMLKSADLTLIVNQEGLELYKKNIQDFDTKIRFELLSNGVDIESYKKTYPIPKELQKQPSVLYVGAWNVEWELLFKAANECPSLHFFVVCPNYPKEEILRKIKHIPNLIYIPGIKPEEVPAWITNCNLVMIPYETDFYKNRPLGITAKYYQAMAAHKPIVAYCDTPKLSEAGITVTYTYDDFINAVKELVNKSKVEYSFNLADRDWNDITKRFLKLINQTVL